MYNIPIPLKNHSTLWVAESDEEAEYCAKQKEAFVIWDKGYESLLALIMIPILKKHIPGIDWNSFFDFYPTEDIPILVYQNQDASDSEHHSIPSTEEVYKYPDASHSPSADVAASERVINQGPSTTGIVNIKEWVGNTSYIDIDMLLKMQLLPSAIWDIVESIAVKGDDVHWTEGYNKKRGVPLGTFVNDVERPNLLIIDISNSIPLGISSTMLYLADNMRSNLNADLIITGAKSVYYPSGTVLPNPQEIRNNIGRSNESPMFSQILCEHILPKQWDNVYSFGDNDSPHLKIPFSRYACDVQHVHHFHTCWDNSSTGYAKWADKYSKDIRYDTSWCHFMVH